MTLKIAFCGPNAELNNQLAEATQQLIYEDDPSLSQVVLPDAATEVAERTGKSMFEGSEVDWMNSWATAVRRMDMEHYREADVLISASCGVDNVAMQALWFDTLQAELARKPTILAADGAPMAPSTDVLVSVRAQAVLQVALASTDEEMRTYWDHAYCVLPASITMSEGHEGVLLEYFKLLQSVPTIQENVETLPDNYEAALDVLRVDAREKWGVHAE